MTASTGERTVETTEGRLHVLEAGQGPNTLVLLHGWTRTALVWQSVLGSTPSGWHAVAVNLAAHSDPPKGGYSIPSQAERTLALIRVISNGPVVVAGHSMGGAIAIKVVRRASRARGLILVSTGTRRPGQHRGTIGVQSLIEHGKSREALAVILGAWHHRRPTPEMFDRILDEAMAWPYEALIGMRVSRDTSEFASELADLPLPLLVLHGDEDNVRSLGEARAMVDAVQNGRLIVLPAVGHTPTEEDPTAAAAAIWEFATSLVPASAKAAGRQESA